MVIGIRESGISGSRIFERGKVPDVHCIHISDDLNNSDETSLHAWIAPELFNPLHILMILGLWKRKGFHRLYPEETGDKLASSWYKSFFRRVLPT